MPPDTGGGFHGAQTNETITRYRCQVVAHTNCKAATRQIMSGSAEARARRGWCFFDGSEVAPLEGTRADIKFVLSREGAVI